MSEVAHNAQHDFWRPPLAQRDAAAPAMVEVCQRCGAEFVVGSRFCHACGAARQVQAEPVSFRSWTRHLEFHNIQSWMGLSTASLIAFLFGAGCVIAAIVSGFIYSVHSVLEWQAVQMFRIQWLLAAIALLIAGILLRRSKA